MSEWKYKTITEVTDIRVSNVDKKIHEGKTLVKLCNYMDVYSNHYIRNDIPFQVGSADINELYRFALSFDDVIITKDSETPDDIAVPAVVSEQIDNLVCGYHLAILRPNPVELDGHFFMHKLQLPEVKNYFFQVANGSTRYGLTIGDIENVKVNIPTSLAEQRKIARILSTVDAVIEKTEAAIAKYQAIKAGMMRDLFTRGIDLATGKLRPSYEESPQLYRQTELGWVPKEWEVVRIDEILKSPIRDFGSFAMTNLITFEESGVIFIKSEMVQDGFIDYTHPFYISDEVHNLLFKSMVFTGDILFTKIGAIGRVATYDGRYGVCNSNAATAKIQVKRTRCIPDYIAYKLTSVRVINEFEKSVISTPPRINLGDINSLKIKLPKKNEQCEIAKMIKSIINKTEIESVFLLKKQQLKQALMSDLLTGKVGVKYEEEKKEAV